MALRLKGLFLGLCLAAAAIGSVDIAFAQGRRVERGDTIQRIVVEGTNRVDPETVGSYLAVKVGDAFDQAKLDQSLKTLFDTGLFRDVRITREGNALVVRVVENPIVNRIAFEGNNKIKDNELAGEIPLRARAVYSKTQVEASVRRILEMYRTTGRFGATVTPKLIELPQNRVNLVFEINEGSVTPIRRIRFVGNRAYSDSDLRDEIETKESAWWRFFGTADVYDAEKLNADKENLRKFYLSRGYADVRIVSAIAELAPDKSGFFLTFTVQEGERYTFGTVDVTTNLRGAQADQFKQALRVRPGERFSGTRVEDTVESLGNRAGTQGYAFVKVNPQIQLDREGKKVNIVFEVQEGPKVFVERIEVRGNTRTRDEVIRREIRIAEGDAFNTDRVQLSRRRLNNLGFFERVEITTRDGSAPDRVVLVVTVAEKSTGEFTIGAGFSTDEGALGSIGIKEINFMGRGQELNAQFFLSQRSTSFDFRFTEPYFLGKDISLGFDGFRRTRDFTNEGGFNTLEFGFRLRTGYRITEFLVQSWTYELMNRSIRDINTDASPLIAAERGRTTTSSIATTLAYDTRDNRFQPTEGYLVSGTVQFAGLGGSERLVKVIGRGAYHYSFAPNWVVSFLGEAGMVEGLGSRSVRLGERFFIGGESFRGFRVGGIGPRDRLTGDALGANMFYVVSSELTFPLGLPKELGILGRAFVDFGSAFEVDITDPRVLDERAPRLSVGAGVSWASPFGPVRIDFGFPVIKRAGDRTQIFHFRFGTRF